MALKKPRYDGIEFGDLWIHREGSYLAVSDTSQFHSRVADLNQNEVLELRDFLTYLLETKEWE